MAITKVSDLKLGEWEAPVSTLPDVPTDIMSAGELKERFDSNSNELKEKFNALADTLTALGIEDAGVITENNGYTKDSIDELLEKKADAVNVYTKNDTDLLLEKKANAINVYTKDESIYMLNEKVNKDDVYTKAYINDNYYTENEVMDITSAMFASKEELARVNNDVMNNIESVSKTSEKLSNKGIAGGYASLDGSGKVPALQIPLGTDENTAYPGNLGSLNETIIRAVADQVGVLNEECVRNFDYATADDAGVVKVEGGNSGIGLSVAKRLVIVNPNETQILEKTAATQRPITPSKLDIAAKAVTHQVMSEVYDPAGATNDGGVKYTYGGAQPVSYDAVKAYVDAKFEELKALIGG